MTVKAYQNGIRIAREVFRVSTKIPKNGRGKVTRFSSASRLRLREWLLTREIPSCEQFGVCLTIPVQDDMSGVCAAFEKAVHRFRTYFLRSCPEGGFIWRVELQRNRMPHLHLVAFLPSGVYVERGTFLRLWHDSIKGLFVIPSLLAFLSHGVRVDRLDGNISAYRYICDHTGKRKQAQLGYKGRQWGVVGRANFVERLSESYFVPPCIESSFNRMVRRICSFTVKCPCVFGSKHIRKKGVNAVMYVSLGTIRRFLHRNLAEKKICPAEKMYFDLPF